MKRSHFSSGWFWVLVFTLIVVLGSARALASVRDGTAIIKDASESMKPFAAEINADEKALLSALPAGERMTLIQIDATARVIFEATLDGLTRTTAVSQLEAIRATGRHTDLGLALEESVRRLSPSGRIIVFTDGVARPSRNSRFRGKSFEQLLNDASLIPDDVQVIVRLYGEEPLAVTRPNIHILRARPDWSKFVVSQNDRSQEVSDKDSSTDHGDHNWVTAGLIMVLLTLVAVGMAWAMKRFGARRRAITEEEEKMKQSLELHAESPFAAPVQEYKKQVAIDIARTGETAILDQERPAIVIGGRWDADVYLAECGDASVRIFLSPEHPTGLALENCGQSPVCVGQLKVPPGKARWLPDHVEVSVGNQVIHICQEVVIITLGNQGGEENVELNA